MLVSLLVVPSSNKEFLVEISGTTVTITCPMTEESIIWMKAETQLDSKGRKYVIENHDSSPARVSCSTGAGEGARTYAMYLNARGE